MAMYSKDYSIDYFLHRNDIFVVHAFRVKKYEKHSFVTTLYFYQDKITAKIPLDST